MTRLLAIAWKELVQLRRDRMTFGMMVGLPIMQLMLFGYAINTDVRHMPTLVYDQDRSAEARDFVARMAITGFYDVIGHVRDYSEIERALRQGRARVAIVIPTEFGDSVTAGLMVDAIGRLVRRHVVVFVALRDPLVDRTAGEPPDTTSALYRAVVSREDYVTGESQGLLDRLFGGQIAPLVAHYARHRALSPEEIARLKKLIADLETDDE